MKSLENLENEYIGTSFGKTDIESVELVETVEVSKIPTIKQTIIEVDSENVEVLPTEFTKKYVTNSLRQSNYDTESALSELVDNSIDANADIINIVIPSKEELKSGKKAILIHDDGEGMTLDELKKSFSFGSNREYSSGDIGNYGVGMKSAMAYLSQYVTVETKRKDDDFVSVAIWDIDNDPLNRKFFTKNNDDKNFISGTKIQMYCKWGDTKKSRLEDFSHTQPAYVKKIFSARYFRAFDKIKTSSGGDSLPKLRIIINGSDIIPFDPLYRKDDKVRRVNKEVEIKYEGKNYPIKVDGYYIGEATLTGFDKSDSDTTLYKRQGIYLLLNDKYIQVGGSWLGVRQPQHGANYMRVEIEIEKDLIEYFGISNNKNSIIDLNHNSEESSLSSHSEKNKLITAIREVYNEGDRIAKKLRKAKKADSLSSEEQNNQAEKFTEVLNKKLKKIGLNKLAERPKNKKEPKGGTKVRPKGLKYDKRLVIINHDNSKIATDPFFDIEMDEDLNKVFLELNVVHPFYNKYINVENGGDMIEFLGAIALAQVQAETFDDMAESRSKEFWSDVSKFLNRFSWTED
jgi:hypothetical protein